LVRRRQFDGRRGSHGRLRQHRPGIGSQIVEPIGRARRQPRQHVALVDECIEPVRLPQNSQYLIAEGHTAKEIAKTLGTSLKTAEAYRAELMKELDIHDIASLTGYALRKGKVSPDT
jgi:hypothetical protein